MLVQRTQQQFWFGRETGFAFNLAGSGAGSQQGLLAEWQGGFGALLPPRFPALTSACLRAPHIIFIFQLPPWKKLLWDCWAVPLPPSPAGTAANHLCAPPWGTSEQGDTSVGWAHLNPSKICFPKGRDGSPTLTPLFFPCGVWMPN